MFVRQLNGAELGETRSAHGKDAKSVENCKISKEEINTDEHGRTILEQRSQRESANSIRLV
jgi:hypothetical protein